MIIFAIETSANEAAAALVEVKDDLPIGKKGKFKILSHVVSSQIDVKEKSERKIPEVARLNSNINILPFISLALAKAKIEPEKIDKIAVTTGPGLISSLIEKIVFLT